MNIEYIRRFAPKDAQYFLWFNIGGGIKEYFKIKKRFNLKKFKSENVILIWNGAARRWFDALNSYPNLTEKDLSKLWD